MNSSKRLLSTLQNQKSDRPPYWFMRQAGRYLPEYRDIRATQDNFLQFCYTPPLASEVTLQPITRFAMDGAIIFSDILVVPHALGMKVWFEKGHGPRLHPVRNAEELAALSDKKLTEFLRPVYEALTLTRQELPQETTLIGFVGAPWTLATYVVEGRSGSDFSLVKEISNSDEPFFSALIERLTHAVILHAKAQIKAGAEVIQIFDSWAGILSDDGYKRWVIEPTIHIVSALKKEHPNIPIIGFPRQSGTKFSSYVQATKVDAVSVDLSVPKEWVRDELLPQVVVQGCLDPDILAGDQMSAVNEAKAIVEMWKDYPFIFNLSHGVIPQTPPENVKAVTDYLRQLA